MIRRATIDGCWRYDLERDFRLPMSLEPDKGHVTFVMLNPSDANGVDDDPTVRKCIGFTRRWGFERFFIVNMWAFVSSDPDALALGSRQGIDIVGPRNDEFILRHVSTAARVVCAWGAWHNKMLSPPRIDAVLRLIVSTGQKPWCLGKTKDGQPKHPLMLSYATDVVPML